MYDCGERYNSSPVFVVKFDDFLMTCAYVYVNVF